MFLYEIDLNQRRVKEYNSFDGIQIVSLTSLDFRAELLLLFTETKHQFVELCMASYHLGELFITVSKRQKCYRNPFLGPFETPKEYGRHCHRYLGKVKFFRVIWITKRCQKCDFCLGRALKAPPLMVRLK